MLQSTERTNRAIDHWSETIGTRLLSVLAPLYQEGPRHPELFGSAVLLEVAGLRCVVTAAHVAETPPIGRPCYFGAAEMLIPLSGFRYTSPIVSVPDRSDDRIDLAWWVLPIATAARLSEMETIGVGSLEVEDDEAREPDCQYYVNGYPYTRQPRSFDGRECKAETFAFITDELRPEEYSVGLIDRAQNLFVHFDKSDTFRGGERVTGPNLEGVSGGAIWKLNGSRASLSAPKLAAIVISWRKAKPKGIIGVRTQVLARAILRHLPQMREHSKTR